MWPKFILTLDLVNNFFGGVLCKQSSAVDQIIDYSLFVKLYLIASGKGDIKQTFFSLTFYTETVTPYLRGGTLLCCFVSDGLFQFSDLWNRRQTTSVESDFISSCAAIKSFISILGCL